jgi:hypothetical protein
MKTILFAAAVAACTAFSAPSYAAMDCEAELDKAQSALNSMKNLTAGQRASRARIALQAYDLCTVGDEKGAFDYFKMMQKNIS